MTEHTADAWDGLSPASDAFRLSGILSDEYSARIVLGTAQKPVSALYVSRKWGIPIAACYRRLRDLEAAGLIASEPGPAARNGRRTVLYRSRVRSLQVLFEEGRFRVHVDLGSGSIEATAGP
ncbi:MAG TPA: winged helix-turn-helix domain-containing protein [Thermoplasmata archaeon]|jgi:predicted ArsR family transcriptional regulator|nr:winged helix-turn-helix domain-containing protein [Thermoplasmata archaeon]